METKKQKKKQPDAQRVLFLAPSNYGKSYLISEWVIERIKDKQFNPRRICIFSPTAKTDDSQQILIKFCEEKYKKFSEHNIFENIDEEFLYELFLTQKKIKEQTPQSLKQWCIIMDDVLSESILGKKNSILTKFFTLGRHFGISIVTALQYAKNALSTTNKAQMTIIAVGRLSSQYEIEDIIQSYGCGAGKNKKECMNNMLKYFYEAIKSRNNHGFLVIHTTRQYGDKRIEQNFDGIYFDKKEDEEQKDGDSD